MIAFLFGQKFWSRFLDPNKLFDFSFALTPPRRLSYYDDGEENAAHPHMMICRLR